MTFRRKTKGQQVREAALHLKLGEYPRQELAALPLESLARSYGLSLPAAQEVVNLELQRR